MRMRIIRIWKKIQKKATSNISIEILDVANNSNSEDPILQEKI
tara:strand:- start:300 stop:428 length:129 start_codon:yes stop_codon:yes gene_type:complete